MKQVEIKLLGRDFKIACPEEEEAKAGAGDVGEGQRV